MLNSKRQSTSTEAITLALVAALLRLIPHPPNFAPLGGASLLSGAKVSGWQAYLVPVLAMLASDPILSYLAGYPAFSSGTPVIYLSLVLTVLLGKVFLRNEQLTPTRVGFVAVAGSLQFFALTNFAVWWQAVSLYSRDWSGLATCYVAGLPFLGRTMLADLFYSAAFFVIYRQLERRASLFQASTN